MNIIAALTEPDSIHSCLEGVGMPSRAPPIAPARPRAQPEFDYVSWPSSGVPLAKAMLTGKSFRENAEKLPEGDLRQEWFLQPEARDGFKKLSQLAFLENVNGTSGVAIRARPFRRILRDRSEES